LVTEQLIIIHHSVLLDTIRERGNSDEGSAG
jgi:hypothetical protein